MVDGVVGIAVIRTLYPDLTADEAAEVMLPHDESSRRSSQAASSP